jgi:hypothetical protein
LDLLEENTKFDDNALAAFNDKFSTPLSHRSIMMLGSLVKKMEKVKKPKDRKVDSKEKATEITGLAHLLHPRCGIVKNVAGVSAFVFSLVVLLFWL